LSACIRRADWKPAPQPMPTLQLYREPVACPDAWHQVASPGGYEWRHFDAEDPATDTRIVAMFFQGRELLTEYRRRYRSYRRWPTRRAPPLPREYPAVHLAAYRAGKVLAKWTTGYSSDAFTAAAAAPDVTV